MPNTVVPGEKSTENKETNAPQASATTPSAPSEQGQSNVVQSSPNQNSTTGVQDFSPKETTPQSTEQQPATPTAPTTTEAPATAVPAEPVIPDGYKGFRQSLIERGITDNRIGWNADTGAITIDGYDVSAPTVIVDGTSYGSAKEIDDATMKAYELAGNPLVALRDRAVQEGMGNIVDWNDNNKQATLGGNVVPYVYNSDGTVYATTNDVNSAIDKYRKDNNITSGQQVKDDYDKEWMPMLKDVLNRLLHREQFKYDPDSDDIYAEIKKDGEENIENAYRRVMNDNNSSTSGGNSNVVGMAMAAKNQAIDNLNDRLVDREQTMYDRYADDTDIDIKTLEELGIISDSDFDKEYTVERDNIEDIQYSNEREDERQEQETERSDKLEQQDIENNITYDMLPYELQNMELTNDGLRLQNESQQIANDHAVEENTIAEAVSRGRFIKEDEAKLPWLKEWYEEHGSYPSPWEAQVAYTKDIGKAEADVRNGVY